MAHKTYIYESLGSGTVILFIHGFLGSPEHFDRFIALLPKNISVYNILLHGHGGTVRDFAKASMDIWKSQINETVDLLAKKYSRIYIVAHSMGTFFAINSANRHPTAVKSVFLLQTPLKIGVKPAAAVNTFKSLFNFFGDDLISTAYKNAHSVSLNLRLWEYLGWIPRYMELFREARAARENIKLLKAPCIIFQSSKDELVSLKSLKHIPQNDNFTLHMLENSAHFIYSKQEQEFMETIIINSIK